MDLYYNGLSGEIPAELGSLSNLIRLSLGGNALSGEIPPELGNLSNLIKLGLVSNDLSGEIPAWLGSLSNLIDLSLSHNKLSGGDTGGAGQPLQPDISVPKRQLLERVRAKQPGRPVERQRRL